MKCYCGKIAACSVLVTDIDLVRRVRLVCQKCWEKDYALTQEELPMEQVIIGRECCDLVNENGQWVKKYTGRVFIVGPVLHTEFGHALSLSTYLNSGYSSTPDREKASRFPRDIADQLLTSGKWRTCRPEIESVGHVAGEGQ